MTDVLLVQTADGGEIQFDDAGNVMTTDDLRSSVYISLFGGGNWWADINEPDTNNKLTGETGRIIKRTEPSASNLLLLQDAAVRDLQWMLNIGAASKVTASASLTNINRLTMIVSLEYDERQADPLELKYSLNWTR